jgi:hypothetical protein
MPWEARLGRRWEGNCASFAIGTLFVFFFFRAALGLDLRGRRLSPGPAGLGAAPGNRANSAALTPDQLEKL